VEQGQSVCGATTEPLAERARPLFLPKAAECAGSTGGRSFEFITKWNARKQAKDAWVAKTEEVVALKRLRFLGNLTPTGGIAPIRPPAKRRRINTVLQEIMYPAAELVAHARRLTLDFGRNVANRREGVHVARRDCREPHRHYRIAATFALAGRSLEHGRI
jgi:hypothetical protein